MEGSINMRNNLIQNFYIIGVPYQDIITYIDSNETINLSKSFNPEILSKFPKDIDNMNTISDNLIIEHCFPNDFYIKKGGGKYGKKAFFDHSPADACGFFPDPMCGFSTIG